jgi:hypothetical protein
LKGRADRLDGRDRRATAQVALESATAGVVLVSCEIFMCFTPSLCELGCARRWTWQKWKEIPLPDLIDS